MTTDSPHRCSGAGSLGRMFARARVEWCMLCTRRAAALARAPSPQPLMSRRGHTADAAEGEARVATGIWLHSLRYALPGLQLHFESAPPRFASEDFDDL